MISYVIPADIELSGGLIWSYRSSYSTSLAPILIDEFRTPVPTFKSEFPSLNISFPLYCALVISLWNSSPKFSAPASSAANSSAVLVSSAASTARSCNSFKI